MLTEGQAEVFDGAFEVRPEIVAERENARFDAIPVPTHTFSTIPSASPGKDAAEHVAVACETDPYLAELLKRGNERLAHVNETIRKAEDPRLHFLGKWTGLDPVRVPFAEEIERATPTFDELAAAFPQVKASLLRWHLESMVKSEHVRWQ
jgi:hypothetical protein